MRARLSHIGDLLRHSDVCRALLERRQGELGMLAGVRACLPESAHAHCLDVALGAGELSIVMDSSAWATRVRFLAEDIQQALQGQGVRTVRVRVRPAAGESGTGPRQEAGPKHRLTSSATAHLLEAADHMKDPELSRVFRSFALKHVVDVPGDDAQTTGTGCA